jgi:hypothetical protein
MERPTLSADRPAESLVELCHRHVFEDKAFLYRFFILLPYGEERLSMGTLRSELDIQLRITTRIMDGLVQTGMLARGTDPGAGA